jgi:hypothetical protein
MNDEPAWDDEVARNLVGSTVLVGLTYQRPEGDEQVQLWGVVIVADKESGICLDLRGARAGEEYWLPPQTNVYRSAAPGVYMLRATGEKVENPDYTASWTVTPPAN